MNSNYLTLASEASPCNVRHLRVCVQEWLRTLTAPTGGTTSTSVTEDLPLAVHEALANVAEHAYRPYDPDPVIHLHAWRDYNDVLVTVTDHGRWRTPRPTSGRGRGLLLMRGLAKVDLHPTASGTTVHMRATLQHG
jgi:anti-sigma regulatory factor (Ser/Thr protein kinase)